MSWFSFDEKDFRGKYTGTQNTPCLLYILKFCKKLFCYWTDFSSSVILKTILFVSLSKPPIFNQNKLIYSEHTSGISLYNMQIYATHRSLFVCCNTSVISRIADMAWVGRTLAQDLWLSPHPICSSSVTHTTVFLHDENCLHTTFTFMLVLNRCQKQSGISCFHRRSNVE